MIKDMDEMEGYSLIINCIDTYISNNPQKIAWTFSYKTLKKMSEGLLQHVNLNFIASLYEEDGLCALVDEYGKLVIMLPEDANNYLLKKSLDDFDIVEYKKQMLMNSLRKESKSPWDCPIWVPTWKSRC